MVVHSELSGDGDRGSLLSSVVIVTSGRETILKIAFPHVKNERHTRVRIMGRTEAGGRSQGWLWAKW